MSIRCANHGWNAHVYHDDAAAVRACFADTKDFNDQASQEPHRAATFGPDTDAYWDAQMQAKERAEDERVAAYKARRDGVLWPENPTVALNARARTRDPEVQITKLRLDLVQPGGYAVPDPGDGKLRFLVVDCPDEGQWKDWKFVKVMASDELHKLGSVNPRYGTYKGKATDLITRLAGADMVELNDYRIAYGKELGECGFCRRTLTDEDSRGLGYGPVCAGRNGLYHPRARAS